MKRFPWGLTAATAVLLAVLISLGVWQTQRMGWKNGLIAQAEAAAARPAQPIETVLAEGGDLDFRKVVLACPGLASAPYVELQTILDGEAGVRLISACRPAGVTQAFLIDRGFVSDSVTTRPQVEPSTLPTAFVGQLRHAPDAPAMAPPPSNGRFYARDEAAMAAALEIQGPVSDLLIFAETPTNPELAALRPVAPPAAFSNNHLGYAMTWFGLALVLAGFYVAMVMRRFRKAPEQA